MSEGGSVTFEQMGAGLYCKTSFGFSFDVLLPDDLAALPPQGPTVRLTTLCCHAQLAPGTLAERLSVSLRGTVPPEGALCAVCYKPVAFSTSGWPEHAYSAHEASLLQGASALLLPEWLLRAGVEPLTAALLAEELSSRVDRALQIYSALTSLSASFRRAWGKEQVSFEVQLAEELKSLAGPLLP